MYSINRLIFDIKEKMAKTMKKDEEPTNNTSERRPVVRAAVIVIGDEILSGRISDKNVAYLAQRLGDVGIQLAQVRIIPDIEEEIVTAVNDLRKKYSYVFTTGGIGPTHDDITAKAIARAFRVPLHRNMEAYKRLSEHYHHDDFTDARKKMADMPYGVEQLIDNPVSIAPGFILDNVYVLAGVPEIMQAMLDGILPLLKGGAKVSSKTISCFHREGEIAAPLSAIDKKYDRVAIGSYPYFRNGHFGVSIVLRSVDEIQLQRAVKDIKNLIITLNNK